MSGLSTVIPQEKNSVRIHKNRTLFVGFRIVPQHLEHEQQTTPGMAKHATEAAVHQRRSMLNKEGSKPQVST